MEDVKWPILYDRRWNISPHTCYRHKKCILCWPMMCTFSKAKDVFGYDTQTPRESRYIVLYLRAYVFCWYFTHQICRTSSINGVREAATAYRVSVTSAVILALIWCAVFVEACISTITLQKEDYQAMFVTCYCKIRMAWLRQGQHQLN